MVQLAINGLAMGCIYALVALGLLTIFNAVRIVNFGQGQLLMTGAFLGLATIVQHRLPFPVAYVTTLLAMGAVGLAFMLVAYFPLRGKPPFLVILTTIAMGIVLENLALIIWGPMPRSLPSPFGVQQVGVPGAMIPVHMLFIFAVTGVLVGLQYLFLTRTTFGRMMQATSQDMEMARLVGIRVVRTIAAAFAMGAAFAGAAGLLVAPLFLAETTMGGMLGLKGFVVSVLGGFGSLPGAVVGGLILGLVETLAAGYVSSNFRDAYAFILMVATLFIWPRGLFGEKISERV
jgi:branched-chain amino acid transport system permease protein